MPTPRVPMSKQRQILQLLHDGHLSTREIAAALHISKSSVGDIAKAARLAGLDWEAANKLSDDELGATTYLAGIAMIGVALGFILRSTSGAIGVLVAAVFILPGLLGLLPESFSDSVVKYLPSKLGESMRALNPGDDLVAVGPAFLIFLAWVVGLLCVAAVLVRRRDA